MKKKIAFLTGTRADYGLMRNLIRLFQSDESFLTYILATGTHLSLIHNRTIDLIYNDGLKNIVEISMNIEGDCPVDICTGLEVELQKISCFFSKNKLDLLIVLGDRYELWPVCMAATIYNIPICHIHGGESTEGLIDEAIRHSVTKMSHLHFCSHELYRRRIVRMGEQPGCVHNVGAIGLDRIKRTTFLSKKQLENRIGTKFRKINILCTFHPVTLKKSQTSSEMDVLLAVIGSLINNSDFKVFVTLPNADTYSEIVKEKWNKLIDCCAGRVFAFVNFEDDVYLSLMNAVDLIVGNSSSGILEAPFLNKAVVNIGDRQRGRLSSPHVIHAKGACDDIEEKIKIALSSDFQSKLIQSDSIYGDGETSNKIYEEIRKAELDGILFKKFYDGERI